MKKQNITESVQKAIEEKIIFAAKEAEANERFLKDLTKMLMSSATSFCTVLLAEQVDDDEAAVRSAEIATSLYDEVQYQIYRMINPAIEEELPLPKETVKKTSTKKKKTGSSK